MLSEKWKEYDYQAVYDTSSILLEKKPFNNTILVYRGYAAFYLAVSATESQQAQQYIEESIHCLRLALSDAKKKTLGQIQYMLGKAYFYKNSISSYHYYADLAAYHLNEAKLLGYKADDIAEYLGLSYAQLNMTMESIAAKTAAKVEKLRSVKAEKAGANSAADALGKMPNIIRVPIFVIVKVLGKFGLLPDSLTSNNIYFSSMIISNLGSIHCGAIYHNLADFGTCSSRNWTYCLCRTSGYAETF